MRIQILCYKHEANVNAVHNAEMRESVIRRKLLAACLVLAILVTGCQMPFRKEKPIYTAQVNENDSEDIAWENIGMSADDAASAALDYASTMSLEEKVGQLFIVNLEQLDDSMGNYYEHQKISSQMKESLEKYHVGGVILFSRNISKRKQTKKMIRQLQHNSGIPMFVTVDEEGGDVARIASNSDMKTTQFPTMEEIGQNEDSNYVYNMGRTIGQEIREIGFNVDFAPVADVRTSELNKEIGSRSFGDDPEKVSELVSAFVTGIQEVNISATLKHFPGQGSSKGDTHQGSVNIDNSISSLRKVDFKPFEAGIEAGADFIMVSHISVSEVTESSEPASMSELIMTTILRDELGYDGLVITDALDMTSITQYYSPAEAACGAFQAGSDLILMPENLEQAYQGIIKAIQEGEIDKERLEQTVFRILQLKFQRGIMSLEDLARLSATPSPTPTATPTAEPVRQNRKNSKKKNNKR